MRGASVSVRATARWRFAVVALALALAACDGSSTPSTDAAFTCSLPGGRTVGGGLYYGGGRDQADCNMCRCDDRDGGLANFCYTAGCGDASVGRRCQSADDCGEGGACLFDQGCGDTPGYCVPLAQGCPRGAPTTPLPGVAFCGCDGRTYASNCPTVRYAHVGACTP